MNLEKSHETSHKFKSGRDCSAHDLKNDVLKRDEDSSDYKLNDEGSCSGHELKNGDDCNGHGRQNEDVCYGLSLNDENNCNGHELKPEEDASASVTSTLLKKNVTVTLEVPSKRGRSSRPEVILDGPWSYVVGMASFLAQIMLGGFVYTGGIYYTFFIEEFHDMGTVAVSWMCNLPVTLWFLGGPFGSMLTNRFGTRGCSYIGGFLSFLGLSMCYFTRNFYILFLGYGVIAGFGHGIMYIGFVTSVSRYFKKYRAMVTILTTLGPMVGMSLYSFLIPYLYRRLHWQGSLLVLGGIALNICACASVLFPVQSVATTKKMAFVDVLKIKTLFLFGCNSIFCSLASSLIFLHLPSLVISNGHDASTASLTLTVFAISNSAAKVICSIVGQFIAADPVYVYNGFLTAFGISAVLLPAHGTVAWILTFVVVLSFSFNVCGGHTMEVVLDLTGPEKFTSGVGITQLCKGIGYLLAGPLAGFMFEASGSYRTSFYVSGCLDLFGCGILLPVIIRKCRGVQPDTKPRLTVYVSRDELENSPEK